MANRFPLIVDSSGQAAIKEIASGDNLDLTGNGIVGAGTVALTNLTVGGSQGSDGQILTSTGSGVAWEDAAGGGGGAWNVISSQTVSSSVAYVTFTGMTGYKNYKLVWNNVVHSGQQTYIAIQVSTNGGTSFSGSAWEMFNLYFNTQSTSLNVDIHNGSEGWYYVTDAGQINQFNTDAKHAGEVMFWAFNESNYTYARSLSLGDKSNEYIGVNQAFGQLRQNTGYNALRFRAGANFTGGTFTLYGLANS